jgi:hypothetical protein
MHNELNKLQIQLIFFPERFQDEALVNPISYNFFIRKFEQNQTYALKSKVYKQGRFGHIILSSGDKVIHYF